MRDMTDYTAPYPEQPTCDHYVFIVWEDRAEKGEEPELIEIFASKLDAETYICQFDPEEQETLDVEERAVMSL